VPSTAHAKNLKAAALNIIKLNTMPNSIGSRSTHMPQVHTLAVGLAVPVFFLTH
jgi:hypothetical protein